MAKTIHIGDELINNKSLYLYFILVYIFSLKLHGVIFFTESWELFVDGQKIYSKVYRFFYSC